MSMVTGSSQGDDPRRRQRNRRCRSDGGRRGSRRGPRTAGDPVHRGRGDRAHRRQRARSVDRHRPDHDQPRHRGGRRRLHRLCRWRRHQRQSSSARAAAGLLGSVPVKIAVRGLRGGHSGLNIIENRGNAIKLVTRTDPGGPRPGHRGRSGLDRRRLQAQCHPARGVCRLPRSTSDEVERVDEGGRGVRE